MFNYRPGMLKSNTPVEYYPEHDIWVKREDLSCDGPRFSKTRGVLAHILNRNENVIGVLDTAHSQGGWAVARACYELGRECHLWYPIYKGQDPSYLPLQQREAKRLGAKIHQLPAGRSAVLYHTAKKQLIDYKGYMMPNALKLPETVDETAAELVRTNQRGFEIPYTLRERGVLDPHNRQVRYRFGIINLHAFESILVSCSSGTIAAGLIRGLNEIKWVGNVYFHMGYDRPAHSVFNYIEKMSGYTVHGPNGPWGVYINEEYAYKDTAPKGVEAPFPCNPYYDLKLWAWWIGKGKSGERGRNEVRGSTLMWNIG